MTPSKPDVPLVNSYWVVPGQFLAGEHPVELDADVTRARLTALLDAGLRTFVNLTEVQEKMESYSQSLSTLAEARQLDIETLRIPIRDRGVPAAETLRSILNVIDNSLANGRPAYVHCFAGIGRTGTVVGCYIQRHGLATEENVIGRIAELRSHMPGGNEASPHTPEQVQVVKNWKVGS